LTNSFVEFDLSSFNQYFQGWK